MSYLCHICVIFVSYLCHICVMQSCAMTEIMILAGATLRKMRQEASRGPIYIQKSPQRKLGDDDLCPLVVAKGHECDISTQALCKVVSTLEALPYVTGYAPFSRRTANSPVKVTTSMRNWALRWALAPWLLLLGATLSGDGP